MKIAVVTDAWEPQTNGVVITLKKTAEVVSAAGHSVSCVTPKGLRTVPLPTYPSIRLAVLPGKNVRKMLGRFAADAVHIATEGPLGLAARDYCKKAGLAFTTSYHTQFPQYVRMRFPIPLTVCYGLLRWFHSAADRTLVATETQRQDLLSRQFKNLAIWSRGVDTNLFRPRDKSFLPDPRPISMYMGRVAVEKNIEAFLALDIPGTKYVVGDGPNLATLTKRYPQVRFTGFKFGEELASYVAAADVFVLPSRTDTYGLVLLEAMACGVPVAAYPVTGPIDVVINGVTGVLDEDLHKATLAALALDGQRARTYALSHSWEKSTQEFLQSIATNTR